MNPISFSTLACPNWSIETVIAKASDFGYDGIEWRGGPQGHVQPKMWATQKEVLQKMSMDTGLIAVAVTAYTSFVSPLAEERQANVEELRQYVDLAAELDAPYVRTFLGELPADSSIDDSLYEKISDCLNTASEYADSVGVKIAVEPHDDFVRAPTILPILSRVQHPALRVIWDFGNAFAAGEGLEEGFRALKNRLAYVQVKDGKGRSPNWTLCPVGEGDVQLRRAFELLLANGYEGALSVEWEYAWHPELDPPEIALPAALRTVRELLASAQTEST
jgi:sugar phosphate isomerase/epimerase